MIDPYTRLPELSSAALVTLDEATNGRVCVAIGAGASGFRELGLERIPPPVTAVGRFVTILRTLWQGERAGDVRLEFRPTQLAPPIYLAAEGPGMLRLAGAIADGVILQAKASAPLAEAALAIVHEGLERAGRDARELEVVFRIDVAVADRLPEAYDLLRHRVARRLVAAAPEFAIFRKAGLEVTSAMRRAVVGIAYTNDRALLERIGGLVDDTYVDAFCVAATPDTLGWRLDGLVSLGAQHIILNPIVRDGRAEGLLVAAGAWRRARTSPVDPR